MATRDEVGAKVLVVPESDAADAVEGADVAVGVLLDRLAADEAADAEV